jgi:hypothetical protein
VVAEKGSPHYILTAAQPPAQPPIPLPEWPISGTSIDINIEEDMED